MSQSFFPLFDDKNKLVGYIIDGKFISEKDFENTEMELTYDNYIFYLDYLETLIDKCFFALEKTFDSIYQKELDKEIIKYSNSQQYRTLNHKTKPHNSEFGLNELKNKLSYWVPSEEKNSKNDATITATEKKKSFTVSSFLPGFETKIDTVSFYQSLFDDFSNSIKHNALVELIIEKYLNPSLLISTTEEFVSFAKHNHRKKTFFYKLQLSEFNDYISTSIDPDGFHLKGGYVLTPFGIEFSMKHWQLFRSELHETDTVCDNCIISIIKADINRYQKYERIYVSTKYHPEYTDILGKRKGEVFYLMPTE